MIETLAGIAEVMGMIAMILLMAGINVVLVIAIAGLLALAFHETVKAIKKGGGW